MLRPLSSQNNAAASRSACETQQSRFASSAPRSHAPRGGQQRRRRRIASTPARTSSVRCSIASQGLLTEAKLCVSFGILDGHLPQLVPRRSTELAIFSLPVGRKEPVKELLKVKDWIQESEDAWIAVNSFHARLSSARNEARTSPLANPGLDHEA